MAHAWSATELAKGTSTTRCQFGAEEKSRTLQGHRASRTPYASHHQNGCNSHMCLAPKRITEFEPEPNACRHEHKTNLGVQGHQDAVLRESCCQHCLPASGRAEVLWGGAGADDSYDPCGACHIPCIIFGCVCHSVAACLHAAREHVCLLCMHNTAP